MSILESIQQAEAKAEALKLEANAKVEALLLSTKSEVEIKVKTLFEELELKKETLDKQASDEIMAKEQELNNYYLQEDQKCYKMAQTNIEKAANYIVKKVLLT